MRRQAPELPQEQSSDQNDGNDEKRVIADVAAQPDENVAQGYEETMSTKAPVTTDVSQSLLELKGIIETATCYEEELSELLERCHATVEQFEEHTVAQQGAELQELLSLIDDAKDVAKLCNEDSPFWRVGHRFKISNELRSLQARTVSREAVDKAMKPNTVRRHPPGAKLPVGAPRIHAWHIERKEIIDAVCDQLGASSGYGGANERPRVVGITGLPGSGKSTAASMVIARESVRASFTKGVLWLPAGPGAKDRLPLLMYRLAEMVYEAVNRWKGKAPRAPDVGIDPEDGAAYVRETVGSYRYRLLVVADDVWDEDVLKELMSIGVSILYTTRSDQLLDDVPIRLDKVDIQEAEVLLRGAAELGDTVNLPKDAHELVKRCGSSIMELAFIGRWNVVRGREDERGWQRAVDIVVRAQKEDEGETICPWSTAVLRAGLDELSHDKQIRLLYLSMALFPIGFTFALEDAAALLHDGYCSQEILEDVRQNVTTLEDMAIVAQQEGGVYRMHISHVEFVQEEITKFPKTHERARRRWKEYVSTISVLLSWPKYDLVDVCRALGAPDEDVGASVFDAAVNALSQSDPQFPRALRRVAYLQWVEGNCEAASQKWAKLLAIQTNEQLFLEYPDLALTLHCIGAYQESLGRVNEAKTWFERALSIEEKQLGSDHPQVPAHIGGFER